MADMWPREKYLIWFRWSDSSLSTNCVLRGLKTVADLKGVLVKEHAHLYKITSEIVLFGRAGEPSTDADDHKTLDEFFGELGRTEEQPIVMRKPPTVPKLSTKLPVTPPEVTVIGTVEEQWKRRQQAKDPIPAAFFVQD
ncbi:unnamed protein product [Vitrella brassicaformis CCMP3155]|uniref:Uncharacterized protein n=1 Tax=Vitrella brassicaformis (strain CCMP3155) TaxID=1169540 RepID=A0A0G4FG57_VITBC|nr:unnamed protein product [Vitrella brassicaformis CCMP3155]|eukprot:CEM12048.1 unnamed protein product [Vitrella brassicaformis CCMP3155]